MKILAIAALVLGAASLFGTSRATPFLRWGIIAMLIGILLIGSAAFFTFRGITFGIALALAGAAIYFYGRAARKERLFLR
jgi:hypothetical protein